MTETVKLILCIIALIIVYILTRKFHAWRIKSAYAFIIRDLKEKGAIDPPSAVELPYAKMRIVAMGTRDYRPKALEYMVASHIVGRTDSGRYYLKAKDAAILSSK